MRALTVNRNLRARASSSDAGLTAQMDEWDKMVTFYEKEGKNRFPWIKISLETCQQEYIVEPRFSKDYFKELAGRFKELSLAIVKTLSFNKPYKGLAICCGHAPFAERKYEYRSEEEAKETLRPFNQGVWSFLDICYGEDREKDQQLLDWCKSAGLEAKLIRYDLAEGFPRAVEKETFDLTLYHKITDSVDTDLQHRYSHQALRPGGFLLLPITFDREIPSGFEIGLRNSGLNYPDNFEFNSLYYKKDSIKELLFGRGKKLK